MKRTLLPLTAAMILGGAALAQAAPLAAAKPGDHIDIAGRTATVKVMDITPLVTNQFSAAFHFASPDRPDLKELREKYDLAKVIAPAKTEFQKQVLLCAWVNHHIPFGPPASNPQGALAILKAAATGRQFNCDYFAATLQQAASSLGWPARNIGLKGAKGDGNGTEHSVCEIWSNQYRKWIMFDPTAGMYIEKAGVPLNAFEIRRQWFYNQNGKDLTFVLDAGQKKYHRKDLPIALGTFKNFGPLSVNANSIGKFLIVMYIPTTHDGGKDYGAMFVVKDKLADGIDAPTRKDPTDPAQEAYWPMDQAALKLTPTAKGVLKVEAQTNTPNFANYRRRVDAGPWTDGLPDSWTLHAGTNSLEVAAVNKSGVQGEVSHVVLDVK